MKVIHTLLVWTKVQNFASIIIHPFFKLTLPCLLNVTASFSCITFLCTQSSICHKFVESLNGWRRKKQTKRQRREFWGMEAKRQGKEKKSVRGKAKKQGEEKRKQRERKMRNVGRRRKMTRYTRLMYPMLTCPTIHMETSWDRTTWLCG